MLLTPFLLIFCEFDEKVLDNLSLGYRVNQCLRVKQAAECFCVSKMAEPKTVEKYSAGTAPCTPVFTE